MTTLILVSLLLFTLFFLWLHNRVKFKKFAKIAQDKRKQFVQDMNLRRKQFVQKANSRATELEEDIKLQQENFYKELKNQQEEFEQEIQQERKKFIQQNISTEYKEGWFHATLFWFLVFMLAINAKYLIEIFLTENVDNKISSEIYKSKKYRLTVNTEPAKSTIRIMNIGPKYKAGIALKPDKYILKIDYLGYASQCRTVVIKDSDINLLVRLEKATDTTKKYTLTVRTDPHYSEVKIIGIQQKYALNIQLPTGQYVMKVSQRGYFNHYRCISIENDDVYIDNVNLVKIN